MKYLVIGSEKCSWCKKAVDLLLDKGKTYEYCFIEDSSAIPKLMMLAGLTTVPQVFSPSGDYIGGYEKLKKHLDTS